MKTKMINKKNVITGILIACFSLVPSLFFIRELGLKDTAMFFLATFLLLVELYTIRIDRKKSILLFILSFPILVTARKVIYFDLLFFKVTYETIYVTLAFILNMRRITAYIKAHKNTKELLRVKYLLLVAVFIIFALNSSIFSNNILQSMGDVYISIITPILFALLSAAIFDKCDIREITYVLILGVDFSCFYGFMQVFTSHIPLTSINANRDMLTFGYHNINLFSGILTLILPLLIETILYRETTKKEKYFLYSSLGIELLALFITFTRGAWLAFLISAFIILLGRKYRKVLYVMVPAGLLAAKPVLTLIISRGTSNTSLLQNESAVARIQTAFTCLRMMLKYPFGIGGGNFLEMNNRMAIEGYMSMPVKLRTGIQVANYILESAHDLWLQIGVQYGIICMIVFLLIIVNRIKFAFKNYMLNRGAFTSVIVFLIFSVLTGAEFEHKGVLTGTLIIWLIFAMIEINSRESSIDEGNS